MAFISPGLTLDPSLCFRLGNGRIVPYVIGAGGESTTLPLISVTVGPDSEGENACKRTIGQALQRFGYADAVEVDTSSVPYRP
jgi:hypothetical protein